MTGLTDEEKIQKVLQHRADVREIERYYEKHYGLFQLTQMTRIRMEQFSNKLRFPSLIGYKYGIDKDTIEVVFDALAFNEVTYNGNLMDDAYDLMSRHIREFSEDDEVVEVKGKDDQVSFTFSDGKCVTYNRNELR